MKNLKYTLLILLSLLYGITYAQHEPSIIPKPDIIELKDGYFQLNKTTTISFNKNEELLQLAEYLQTAIRKPSGLLLKTSTTPLSNNTIVLSLTETLNSNPEAYTLVADTNKVIISASSTIGLFYGIQTLKQLFPTEIESPIIINGIQWEAPCVVIHDEPRFKYRGMHLDVGRHMFPVAFIKKYIDILAMHKMNTFHWHLTEDQGWRIEIKKYPKLTEVGAYRDETIVGHKKDSKTYDGKKYGGFYTQDEVKEIVAYAASKYITVIPEIELPGHSVAALASYPELGCTGGPYKVRTIWGVEKDVYCAGNEFTFTFLQDVLTEVMELFPSKYIHIGGDECPKDRWHECDKCQKRIKDEGLEDEHELQSYFVTRIEKFLNTNGRKMIGWDEILEGGLAPDATVMSWRGTIGGIEAAQSEHDVIMTPNSHCYFDHYQADKNFEPLAIGSYLPLKRVYHFNPIPGSLDEKYHKYIIGGQGNIWTEYMPTSEHVEYMMNPRIAALSEAIWSDKKDWNDFNSRLQTHFERLDAANINYSNGTYKIDVHVEYNANSNSAKVNLDSEQYKPEIRYTLDGSDPTFDSPLYEEAFSISNNVTLKAAHFNNGNIIQGITQKNIALHKAFGASIELKHPYHKKYKGGGKNGLVNGLTGSSYLKDGYWQGYEVSDLEAIIDLSEKTLITSVAANFVQAYGNWVFFPEYVSIYGSNDGKKFKLISKVETNFPISAKGIHIETIGNTNINKEYRYIKFIAKNPEKCPKGHPGEGKKAWIFCDEIIIN